MSRISKPLRKEVLERALGYCEYCYSPFSFSPSSFAIDHISPQILGGLTLKENLAFCCGNCNNHKYQKTDYLDIITEMKAPLFHPRKNYWPNHFQWNEDETLIIGIIPIGRATANLLDVNRESNINLRILLQLVGLHPPKIYIKN